MSTVSRRSMITAGLSVAGGASGLAGAATVARRYGLIPPDGGGLYGPGETLTYAAQRLLTRHSMAREFPTEQISKTPFANAVDPWATHLRNFRRAVSLSGVWRWTEWWRGPHRFQ